MELKVSVVVCNGLDSGIKHFGSVMARESTMVQRKKFQGVRRAFAFQKFKTALKDDIKKWSNRHRHRCRRYRRYRRRSGSNVERKKNNVKTNC
jgi:hypothetical protein